MNPTWSEITSAPAWQDLPPEQRNAVRQKFYGDFIAPNVPEDSDPDAVQAEFNLRTNQSMVPKRRVGVMESGYRGLAGGVSDTDQFVRKLGGVVPALYDAAHGLVSGQTETGASDAYFGNVVQPAVEYGEAQNIDPTRERQSTAARIAGGVGRTAGDVATMALTGGESAVPRLEAGAAELIGNGLAHSAKANAVVGTRNAADRAQQVLDAGGSGSQATLAAGADLLAGTAINAVPLGVGSGASNVAARFGARAATAAPIGAAGTIIQNDIANLTSPDSLHHELTAGDLGEGALQAALLGGTLGPRTQTRRPIARGHDFLGSDTPAEPIIETPAVHQPAEPIADAAAAERDAYHSAIDPRLAELPDEHRDAVADTLTTTRVGGQPVPGLRNMVDFSARQQLNKLPAIIGNIDADGFKAVNDTFGHETGDEVIRQIGRALSDSFGSDAAWHRSGDEFHVAAGSHEEFDAAQAAAQDAASKITLTATLPDGRVITRTGVGLSFGRGANTQEAEHGLQQDKADRLAKKLRTDRRAASPDQNGEGQEDASPRLQPPADGGVLGSSEGSDARARVEPIAEEGEVAPPASDESPAPSPSLPDGITIEQRAGSTIRVAGPRNNAYANTLRALGGKVGATVKGGQHWTLPASAEPALRARLDESSRPAETAAQGTASDTAAPQVQAAGMIPTVDDAIAASDRAIANRTHTGVLHDFLLKVAPMAAGTDEARAVTKDFANSVRLARYEGTEADKAITRQFTPEQQARMYRAADAHSVAVQEGKPTAGIGLDTLTPAERSAVERLQSEAQAAFDEAKRVGIISGDTKSLPSYVPRMLVKMTDTGAERFTGKRRDGDAPRSRLRTMTANLLRRKHLTAEGTEAAAQLHDEDAEIVKNIRTLPLATAKLREAIAGRTLINQIKEAGKKAGSDTVVEGHDPSRADQRWFTMPDNPAFYTTRAKTVQAPIPEAYDHHVLAGLQKLARDLGVTHERVATMRGRTWGSASTSGEVKTRFAGPISVLAHELGHEIDFKYGLANLLTKRGATARELRAIADLRHEGVNASPAFKRYAREGSEKIAAMIESYIYMPDRMKQVAPQTFAVFNHFLNTHPELAQLRKIKPSLVLGSRVQDVPVTQWERVPLYVKGDFEGGLRAVLGAKEGAIYRGLMALKQKTMSIIMYSPLIHNAVEFGRALPAMPGKVATFRVYFEGNRAKKDPATMREAIAAGMSPIGGHGAFNDATSIANEPNIKPGRSWTSQVLAYVPGLFDKSAGDAVKRTVDRMGDVWHNTLLWDRVADLQAGLYVGLRDKMLAKGMEPRAAQIVAAHMANRYAGTLPREAMSESARKISNLVLFSRTFTLGNLGAMKDALTGLPKDAQAQILRDCGAATLHGALSYARRKALATVLLDIGLMHITNALLQSSIAMLSGDSDLDKEQRGYARRLNAELQRIRENPLELLNAPAAISPTHDNEIGKQDRVLVGHDAAGTAIYLRNPLGKIGEEFQGWLTGPLDMLKRKLSTFARPAYQTLANDKGFGQKVYDADDTTDGATARRLGHIAALFIGDQLPTQAIKGASDFLAGRGDATLDAARVLSPLAGVTFSQGAPGGEAVGEMYRAREHHDFQVQQAMPAIRDKIRAHDGSAIADMTALGIPPGLQKWYVETTLNPGMRLSKHQLENFLQYASPEERARMQREIQQRQTN